MTASVVTGFDPMTAAQMLVENLGLHLAPDDGDPDRYYWAPLPLVDFFAGMAICAEHATGKRFLEIGSGIGTKLFVASAMGWDVRGVEVRANYATVSRNIFPQLPVYKSAAETYVGYDRVDVVYCYRPLKDAEAQARLNRLIADRMRPGALLFSAGGPYPDWLEHISGEVWRT